MKDPTFRHRLEYALVMIVRGAVGLLPEALSRALGTVIYDALRGLDDPTQRLF